MKPSDAAFERWVKNRFGMFIHWGIYSLPARGEWVRAVEKTTREDYRRYFDNFNPDRYNPQEWAHCAKKAGMRYAVITTKHHDGFCLWDTKHTEFKVTNTPYGKDLLRPFVDAFRQAGIRVGLYYSLLDWDHPDYTSDWNHPMRDDADFKNAESCRDMHRYAQYIRNQVEELLTGFGEIDMMFLDFSFMDKEGNYIKGRNDWESEKLVKLARRLQPDMLLNDRLNIDEEWGWDFKTPEQIVLKESPKINSKDVPWETCQTLSGAWGYHRDQRFFELVLQQSWKSVAQLVRMLCDTVSKGGNLLLNVGPNARGEFESKAKERLVGIGEWMSSHSRSIYGCGAAPTEIKPPRDCRLTYNKKTNRLYVHVFCWPSTGELYIDGLRGKVTYAQLLHDASEVTIGDPSKQSQYGIDVKDLLSLNIPITEPDVEVPVIELTLGGSL